MIRDFDLNELPPNEDNMDLDGASSDTNPDGHIGQSPTKEECDNEAGYLASGATDPNLPIKEQESPQFENNVMAYNSETSTHEEQDEASPITAEPDEGGIFSLAKDADNVPIEEDELPQLVSDSSTSTGTHESLDGVTTINKEDDKSEAEERNPIMPIEEQNVPQILIHKNVMTTSSSSNVSKPWNNTLSCEVMKTEDEDREISKDGISLNATHPTDPVEEQESPQVVIDDKAIEIKVDTSVESNESPLTCEKISSEGEDKEKSSGDSEDVNVDNDGNNEDRFLKRRRVEGLSTGTDSNANGSQPGLQSVQRASRNQLPGFIFLCSMSTIQDCQKYSVFGLKDHRIEAVEKIKPGTFLFLFDCHSKFLHGIYMATSNGGMNLEPNAFKGRFPAQVKYTPHLICPVLPESVFKGFITYHTDSIFKQELRKDQVDSLISLFTAKQLVASLSLNPQPLKGTESRFIPESEFANGYYYKKPASEALLHERALASSAFPMVSHLGANIQYSSHRAANLVRPALQASSHPHQLVPSAFPVLSHVGANFQFLSHRAGELVKLASEKPNQVHFGPHSMLPMGHAGLGGNNASVTNLGAPLTPHNPWHLQKGKRF